MAVNNYAVTLINKMKKALNFTKKRKSYFAIYISR